MTFKVFNKNGEKSDEIEASENIFEVEWNPDLVHEVYVSERSNRREELAHTKDRSEVSGGGAKPWPQKGTGRARHGSIRSPIWTGGGTTFGPRSSERDFSRKVNKKMKTKALFSLLSKKAEDEEIRVLDSLDLVNYKTKEALKLFESLFGDRKKTLFLPAEKNKKFRKAAKNIKKVDVMNPKSLNVVDILQYKFIVFEEDSLRSVENHFSVQKKGVQSSLKV
ncbi:MAG: 50S ribosomal protein L4 [Candidatus Magasanikbacteria bacterium]